MTQHTHRTGEAPTGTIGPAVYTAWRMTTLGATTDAVEQRLILETMGNVAGACFLDVGCGDGKLACVAASRGAEAVGIDPDPAMVAAARARARDASVGATFIEGRIERLPFRDASFDVVAAITVLCFVANGAAAVREMARVLRPGGRLVLGELGRWNLWAALRRIRGWLGSATWKAARFRTASELRALAEQAGLSVTAIRGAVYYPPAGILARALVPLDRPFGALTTVGAAFIALGAIKRRAGTP